MLSANTQLMTVLQRSRGYQCEHSTTVDMKLPPWPKPSRKRAAVRPGSRRHDGMQQRAGHGQHGKAGHRRRTPTRSNRMPTGT